MTEPAPRAQAARPAFARGRVWIMACTSATMVAFAGNSLLSRAAFQTTAIDAASFTAIRLLAGAVTLMAILGIQGVRPILNRASVWSSLFLFVYAVTFSFAYRSISTGAGALILFASAQLLMIGYGYAKGERTSTVGVLLALGGLVAFLVPTIKGAVPISAIVLMLVSGIAWGAYSLIGRSSVSPIASTGGSFLLTIPMVAALLVLCRSTLQVDALGLAYGVLSGSVASAMGYAAWYWVRGQMTAITAGSVQLSVPIISAGLGSALLGESITVAGAVAAVVTLAGVLWVSAACRSAQ